MQLQIVNVNLIVQNVNLTEQNVIQIKSRIKNCDDVIPKIQ